MYSRNKIFHPKGGKQMHHNYDKTAFSSSGKFGACGTIFQETVKVKSGVLSPRK
jgi:hypothetical protein